MEIKNKMVKSNSCKKKILIFSEYFYPHINGIAQYIYGLYESLILSEKYEIHVVTFNINNGKNFEKYDDFFIHRIKCRSVLSGTYNFPSLKDWKKLEKKLEKLNFDYVQTHTRFFISSLLGRNFAKKNEIFYIHTEHGAMFVPHPNFLIKLFARLYDETLGRFVISSADVVTPISTPGFKFCKKLGAKKMVLISNGISKKFQIWDKKLKNSIILKYNISNKFINIVFVGRIVEAKGIQDMLYILSEFKDIKIKFYVIGDGNYLNRLKEIVIELNLNNNVVFLGQRDNNFIRNFLFLMDIFVNPSYAEGLPTSVLEACISNIKVLATDVGGTKDILSQKYLFEPKNRKELKKKLLILIDKKSNETVNVNRFIWEDISNKFEREVLIK